MKRKSLGLFAALLMASLSCPAQVVSGTASRVNSAGQQMVSITGVLPTYAASSTFAATTGVLFSLCGSNSSVVVVRAFQISGTAGSIGTQVLNLVKTSTTPTGGTSATVTPTPFDSNNAASTSSAKSYTAAPTAGTAIGTIEAFSFTFPTATGGNASTGIPPLQTVPQGSQPVVLRGANQCVEIQTSSASVSATLSVTATWTEEAYFPSP